MKPGKMPGGFNINALMKQAQQMQQSIIKKQEELAEREFSATSGGGAVNVTVKNKLIQTIKIEPSVIDPEDAEMLEDLICAAVNQALKANQDAEKDEMQSVTGGVNMPF